MAAYLQDHSDPGRILTEVFGRAGIKADIRFVSDGEQELDCLKRGHRYAEEGSAPTPALALLDLNMPRLDGCKAIRIPPLRGSSHPISARPAQLFWASE
ncbi:hypothetical protein [Rhodopseudomonas telluris]|uniref:Response regulatory domain-containing protein n=1 Tax=Rhodopseudomonas telluris TaxID=644215 RepID=A0ABV6ELP5_9BRAD